MPSPNLGLTVGQRTGAALVDATQQFSETQSALETARGRIAAMSEQLTVMHDQQAALLEHLANQAAKVDRLSSTLDQQVRSQATQVSALAMAKRTTRALRSRGNWRRMPKA